MAKQFELTVRVGSNNLTTVIDVLKNAADIISMKQVEEASAKADAEVVKRTCRPRDGTTAEMVLLEVMKPGIVYSVEDLADQLTLKGFKAATAHPALSPMVRKGKVIRVGTGRVKLA